MRVCLGDAWEILRKISPRRPWKTHETKSTPGISALAQLKLNNKIKQYSRGITKCMGFDLWPWLRCRNLPAQLKRDILKAHFVFC